MNTAEAACRGTDTEVFYQPNTWSDAAKLCRTCPIKLACRNDFAYDPYAYAGGMTPSQRSAWVLYERRRAVEPPPPAPKPSGPRPRLIRVSEEQRAMAIQIFDTEMIGTKAIAERVGIAKSTCQRLLRAAGRHRTEEELHQLAILGGASGGQTGVGERNNEMVKKLLAENYKPKEIADLVGITLGHVYVVRRRLGL